MSYLSCESKIHEFVFCKIFSFCPRQHVGKAWKPCFIPIFDSYASDRKEVLLCPCRALRIYLDRTKSLRGNVDNLFLTYQKGICKAATSSLSRWIISIIRYVYEDLPQGPLFNVSAHDTRRLSASWCLDSRYSARSTLGGRNHLY